MLPTILFIFLLLLAWYFFALYFRNIDLLYWTFGSIFLSLTVLVRPTEFVWLFVTTLIIFFINRNKLSIFLLLLSIIIFANFLGMALHLNNLTYGNYLSIGYQNLQTGELPTELSETGLDYVGFAKLAITPFGFNPKLIAFNFYNYFIEIIWPYIIFILAIFFFLFKKIKNKQKNHNLWHHYLYVTTATFFFILLYYGSWDLADPLVKNFNKISISYIRYFLPLYILILPMVAYGIKRLFFKENRLSSSIIVYFMVVLLSFVSIRMAFFSPHDGLLKNRESVTEYYWQYKAVSENTTKNSIIISDRSDKVFFPKYKVIVSQGDLPLWPRIVNLIEESDVYFYSNKTDNALMLTKEKAREVGLNFVEEKNIYKNFRLFKINKN